MAGLALNSNLSALAATFVPETATALDQRNKQRFLALWKDADPDLPPLKDARLEYSRLR